MAYGLWPLFEKSLRQLLEPLVAFLSRHLSNRLDVRAERGIAPVVSRRLLGIARYAIACGLEQGLRCRGVKAGILARWQVELTMRST